MNKHTKGPWFQHNTDTIYQDITAEPDGNGESIAHVFHQGDFVTGVANARLIAAAPEILDVLKKIMGTDAVKEDDSNKGEGTIYDDARSAIAKAEGAP